MSVFQCQNLSVQSQRDDDYFRCLVLKPQGLVLNSTPQGKEKTWSEKEATEMSTFISRQTNNLPRHSSSTSRGHQLKDEWATSTSCLLNPNTEISWSWIWCCLSNFSITAQSNPRILQLLFSALPRWRKWRSLRCKNQGSLRSRFNFDWKSKVSSWWRKKRFAIY